MSNKDVDTIRCATFRHPLTVNYPVWANPNKISLGQKYLFVHVFFKKGHKYNVKITIDGDKLSNC